MKKNDLITKLQNIKGNPEVVFWNGFVGDYQQLASPIEGELVKQTLNYYLEMCRLEDCCNARNWDLQITEEKIEELKQVYRRFKYECNEYISEEDIKEGRYKSKKVIWLSTKPRGETSYGRGGDLEY